MKKTGLVFDERYLLHDTGDYHPESPKRIQAIYKGLKAAGLLPKLEILQAAPADLKWIESVHAKDYVRRFQTACETNLTSLDCPDNRMCPVSYETALLAAGGVLEAVDRMLCGDIENAFCAIRPPGHHAEKDRAMGFCYFNNVAIAARYLQQKGHIQKVGIVDFDVHHGNGTQSLFEQDPSVFYYSIHQHPSFAYPGTGREFERGSGAGYGFTLNSPVLPGRGDKEYHKLFKRDLFPAFASFQPEVIIVSAGFDAHTDDDMSDIELTSEGFTWMMEEIVAMANRYSNGRIISVLEGGYSLSRLPELAANHVSVLLNA